MRVLHVITDTNVGGGGRYLLNLLSAPAFAGLKVQVACPQGELSRRLERLGVSRADISGRDVSMSGRLVGELLRVMRRFRPHVVHTHASLAGRLAARLLRIPVVYTKHNVVRIPSPEGVVPPPAGTVKRLFNRLSGMLLSDRIIAVSAGVQAELLEAGFSPRQVVHIPNGIDLRPFARFSLPARTFRYRVGTVARLSRQKGLPYLIEAAARVLAAEPRATFLIGGQGPEEPRLREMIESQGLEGRVTLAGFVDDVPGFLENLDVYVLSSLYEGLPLATLEAMAAALPVVATSVGGVPEAVEDGVTGLLVPSRDPVALAEAILALLRDPARADALGRAGRRRVEVEFDARLMAERVVALYREVARP
ncbi:MAG TPA: glycosyltransferase family 4 protein [Firmicutes bacterium]|nr:glycosyltransferase family 4 protein [Bacillota bacterium]